MRDLLSQLRFSLRLLRKGPTTTVLAVLALALGIGMTRWREVEVVRGRGAPTIRLHGRYLQRAADLGVRDIAVSLTHSRGVAAAVAVVQD